MVGFDSIPGFGKILSMVERVVSVAEKLADNTDIREQFAETGVLKAGFTVYDYRVDFVVTDHRKTTIPAEVEIPEE